MLFTKIPIDGLTDNIAERLNISSIKLSFNNWMYVSNHQNEDFDDLPFDCDQRLITVWRIYHLNDDIVEMLNNGLIVEVYMNRM